jgi:hypothetical protein
MLFVIRAADKIGDVGWVQPANHRGSRTIGPLATAEKFPDIESAKDVMAGLPAAYGEVSLEYTVEEA